MQKQTKANQSKPYSRLKSIVYAVNMNAIGKKRCAACDRCLAVCICVKCCCSLSAWLCVSAASLDLFCVCVQCEPDLKRAALVVSAFVFVCAMYTCVYVLLYCTKRSPKQNQTKPSRTAMVCQFRMRNVNKNVLITK